MNATWFEAQYRDEECLLRAFEPTVAELEAAAPRLSAQYNDPYNRAMLTNSVTMSADDVMDHYREARQRGDRLFLLERDGVLMGDADFRHFDARSAEYAILIGSRDQQGRGLGGKFTVMLAALAFREWALERVYVNIIPANQPSLRMFQRLGFETDTSARARSLAEDASDATLSLDAGGFRQRHAPVAEAVTTRRRCVPASDMSIG
jgi:RimJ/RimL family protein N-acetyltransferase